MIVSCCYYERTELLVHSTLLHSVIGESHVGLCSLRLISVKSKMTKSPISALQELAVQKRLPLPEYQIGDSGPAHLKSFICRVNISTHEAIGTGSTKKEAKHNAASNLLEHFGVSMNPRAREMPSICLLPTKSKSDLPQINYIGKLNEYCAAHKFPQPVYTESPLVVNAQFCMICTFLKLKTEGCGTTKKDAKQESAREMLILIKDTKIEIDAVEQASQVNDHIKQKDAEVEKALQKYTDIMKNLCISNNNNNTALNNNNASPKKIVNIFTWNELLDYIKEQGWRHELSVIQTGPLMLCLKINEHTLINYGRTREEIEKKFVVNVVQMLEKGVDFAEPLIKL